jgi:hypothetical protein
LWWRIESHAAKVFVGDGYQHDGNAKDGQFSARFEAKLPKAGKYEVRLAYPPNNNRASNVPVVVEFAGGKKTVMVNQRKNPTIEGVFVSLGEFEFTAGETATVTVSNAGVDGYVVIDGVQWVAK